MTNAQGVFLDAVGTQLHTAALNILATLPPPGQYDMGRVIAALDALLHTAQIFESSVHIAAYKPPA